MYLSSLSAVKKQGRLLLDGSAVEKSENCRRIFFPAVKDPASPIIKRSEDWEGDGIYTWCSRMLFENGVYRLYYMAFDQRDNHYRTGIAESEDGLNWTKPFIGKKDFRGEEVEVSLDTEGIADPCWPWRAVAFDPRPDCPENEKYKAYSFSYNGGRVFLSANGRSWREYKDSPVWSGTSDIVHMMWDKNLGKFVSYYKLWRVRGRRAEDPSQEIDMLFTTFNEKLLSDGSTEITGPRVIHVPNAPDVIKTETLRLITKDQASDDGGGGHLTGAWYSKRVVCRAESDDFIDWKDGRIVLDADSLDRESANIQIAQIFTLGGYYIAFLTMHDQRGNFEQQLAFSADGINWSRPWRGNLISRGAKGEFDSGMVTQPVDPIVLGSKMLLYYGGTAADHTQVNEFAIGRAIMRKDGFAAWTADGLTATVKTKAFVAAENAVELNINAEGGRATVALFEKDGTPVLGCTHENCIPITEDSASYPDCYIPVGWNGIDAPLTSGKEYSVEVRFENAALFSILL